MERQCKQCGVKYPAKTEWQKFCSKDCHNAYWRKIRRIANDLSERGLA